VQAFVRDSTPLFQIKALYSVILSQPPEPTAAAKNLPTRPWQSFLSTQGDILVTR